MARRGAPENANVLWAGYPKSFKTMLLMELAIALATATPFLGRFRVPERRRVGLILMEDARHRARRRYERIAAGVTSTILLSIPVIFGQWAAQLLPKNEAGRLVWRLEAVLIPCLGGAGLSVFLWWSGLSNVTVKDLTLGASVWMALHLAIYTVSCSP